jgi:apolipoprotein N-acyltransferase
MSPVSLVATTGAEIPARRFELRAVSMHLLLAGASAVLLGLAFPRPGWSWLAHVALVPITLLAIRSAKAWTLAWTTFLVGWAWWLVRTNWLYQVTGGGYVALAAYMAVYTPVTMLLVRWFYQRYRSAMVLTLPIVWVSLEYIRCTWLQGGFGWFALGHSQAPWLPEHGASWLIQVSDLFGQHAVSFLVAMTNGLIVDLLTRPLFSRDAAKRLDFSRFGAAVLILWVVTYTVALFYGSQRVNAENYPSREGRPASVRVAVVQTNVPQDNKNSPEASQMLEDWRRMLELTIEAGRSRPKPDLIVWPETMVPAALNVEAQAYYETTETASRGFEQFDQQIRELAQRLGVWILAGSGTELGWKYVTLEGREYELPTERYNSAYLYADDGEQVEQRYDKIHRVPFGEYLPWVENWAWMKLMFMRYLSPYGEYDYTIRPGREYTVFSLQTGEGQGVRFAAPICFEDIVPRATRRMCYGRGGEKRADLLVNITNDGWYAGADQGPQHFQIAVFRCIETRVPMARSVNTGFSGFIDSNGRVLSLVEKGGQNQVVDGWVAADLPLDGRKTFFGRVGSAPIIGLCVATGVLALGGLIPRRKKAETPIKGA